MKKKEDSVKVEKWAQGEWNDKTSGLSDNTKTLGFFQQTMLSLETLLFC